MNSRFLTGILSLIATLAGQAQEIPWKLETFSSAPKSVPAEEIVEEGVRSIYFEGPPFGGKPTKVFAFLGVPENASPEKRVPGIVLLHGGGGTASARWVRLWNKRGYAAIAVDHFGGLPVKDAAGGWKRNPFGGPNHDGGAKVHEPYENQWMFHAVANTLLANSLLGSLPEVDENRIGLSGISWGGVLACTVSGVDPRFRFVAPVYGCGYISDLSEDGSRFVGKNLPVEQAERWRALWDPANYLPRSTAPILWVTGTNDFAFTLRALLQSYKAAKGPHFLCIRMNMPHGQQEGENPEEIRAFADSIVNDGKPLPKILASGKEEGLAWVEFESPVPIHKVEFIYSRYRGSWQNRKWETLPAKLSPDGTGRAFVERPKGVKASFFNITDERGLTISSEPDLGLK